MAGLLILIIAGGVLAGVIGGTTWSANKANNPPDNRVPPNWKGRK